MRFAMVVRRMFVCVVVAVGVGCGDPTGPKTRTTPNLVRLESDPGDYIGAGETHSYTQANAVIAVTAASARLSVKVTGDQWWVGDFQAPAGLSRLQPGAYAGLQRYQFNDPAKGGISWFGQGRGCIAVTGSFTVDSITYVGDSVRAIDLRFEQHCEGSAATLRGTIHWRSGDTTRPAGPVKIPAGLWQPPRGSTPAAGNFVYLQSDAGDFIGGGQTSNFIEPNAPISVTAGGGRVSVSVGGWLGVFQTMNTLTQMKAGYYGGLLRYPFHNPTKGGLTWSGNGRGCNRVSGWFAADRVTYVNGALTALELRFEQHCEQGTPALRGQIRWRA